MRRFLFVLAMVALVLASRGQALEAGAAKVEITPAPGVPLNGYSARMGKGAVGVHDPLWARCVYLDDGQTQVYLVSLDLVVINKELYQKVLDYAPSRINPHGIILTATHTHNGTGGMVESLLFRWISGPFMPEVLDDTARKVVAAMEEAYAKRQRATIGVGVGKQDDLAENRRYPGGPADEQVGVIRVDDADGNAIAILASIAAHPTTTPEEAAFEFSADFPGYYCDEMERLTNPGCVAMFLNGAMGDQRRGNPDNETGWERPEWIGKTLATKAKIIANDIECDKETLHVGYADPEMPRSLAAPFLSPRTVLMTLEVGDTLLTFWPCEPTVEVGLEWRRQALERGYAHEISVSCANDHRFYVVPQGQYSELNYESAMTFYGPDLASWYYRQFSKLITKGEPIEDPPTPEAPQVESIANGNLVRLEGQPYEIGYQRGELFKQAIRDAFQRSVVARLDDGSWLPVQEPWSTLPSFLNQTPIALVRLGIGARPYLSKAADTVYEETLGMAHGADLPFDVVWLLQCVSAMSARADVAEYYRDPFCTMFAVTGDRAGADDCLVGRNFDWPDAGELSVVWEVSQPGARRFVQVGFPWNVGVFTAMNDAGLVVCVERVEALGLPRNDGAPLETVLRNMMQKADDVDDALDTLKSIVGMRGYSVLVADASGPDATRVEYGEVLRFTRPDDGLLLGSDPKSERIDPAGRVRYDRVAQLLDDERIVAVGEIEKVLRDRDDSREGMEAILNDQIGHSVIFEPKALRIHVAFRTGPGQLGEYTTLSLGEDAE